MLKSNAELRESVEKLEKNMDKRDRELSIFQNENSTLREKIDALETIINNSGISENTNEFLNDGLTEGATFDQEQDKNENSNLN